MPRRPFDAAEIARDAALTEEQHHTERDQQDAERDDGFGTEVHRRNLSFMKKAARAAQSAIRTERLNSKHSLGLEPEALPGLQQRCKRLRDVLTDEVKRCTEYEVCRNRFEP